MKQDTEWTNVLRWFAEDFCRLDLWTLKRRGWMKLKHDLHAVLFPGQKLDPNTVYNAAFNTTEKHLVPPNGLPEAQEIIRNVLRSIAERNKRVLKNENDKKHKIYPLPVQERQTYRLPIQDYIEMKQDVLWAHVANARDVVIEPDGKVRTIYESHVLMTTIHMVFGDALNYAGGAIAQVFICDSRDCGKIFLSTRRLRADRAAHYCSHGCDHLESTRRYREAARISESYKAAERYRVSKYYQPVKNKKPKARSRVI